MINLIPPEGHSARKREYVLRVISVYAMLLSGVLIAGIALTLPTYVLVSSQLNTMTTKIEESGDINARFRAAQGALQSTNELARQLLASEGGIGVTEIIDILSAAATESIYITSIQLARTEGSFRTVNLQGVAATRIDLVAFRDRLARERAIERAEVPLSDLARDAELPFVLTITLAHPTHTP